MSSISPINELQLKLAERRSVVEGFMVGGGEVISKPSTSHASTKSSHRSSAVHHQRGSSVVVPSTVLKNAKSATSISTGNLGLTKKKSDSPTTPSHHSSTKTDASSSSTSSAAGHYEFLKVLQSLRRTEDSVDSNSNNDTGHVSEGMATDHPKNQEHQTDDDLTAVTASCSTSLSASTRGRFTAETSVSSILGPWQQLPSYHNEESSPVRRPPRSPTATKASTLYSSMKTASSPTFNTFNSKTNTFDFVTQNNTKSNNHTASTTDTGQPTLRFPRNTTNNDGTFSPKATLVTTPKMKQNPQTKLVQPNAPDRSQSTHKKALKNKPISYLNDDNGLPRQRQLSNAEATTPTGAAIDYDDTSVDSVSGEFRVATTITTTQYDVHSPAFINNPVMVQPPCEEEEEEDNDNKKSRGWNIPLDGANNQNRHLSINLDPSHGTHNSSNRVRTSNSRRLPHVETTMGKVLVPPHMSDDWEKDNMGYPVDWPADYNDTTENHVRGYSQQEQRHVLNNSGSNTNTTRVQQPNVSNQKITYALVSHPPVGPQVYGEDDNSRNELVGRNIITSQQSQDSCSTFAFSSPSSKDIPSIRHSPGREVSSSSSSVPSGLTINVLYKEIMKVRHQMEDTQRSDAIKMEQLCIENRMLRAQLEEERASNKEKDRIIMTERERLADKERVILEERARVADKERIIVELIQKLQEKAPDISGINRVGQNTTITPRRSPVRPQRDDSISPRSSTSSSRRRESSSVTRSQTKPVIKNDVRLEDRRFEC